MQIVFKTTAFFFLVTSIGCDNPITIPDSFTTTEAVAETEVTTRKPTYVGKVIGISDGDTIKVLVDGKQKKIRLEGIDTPEMSGQAFSKAAKDLTGKLCFGKQAEVFVTDVDRYKRDIAEVFVGGKSLNKELLSAGLAWHFKRYNKDPKLAQLETDAKQNRRGLWADPHPIPPWDWRKDKRGPGNHSRP